MIINCPHCQAKYDVPTASLSKKIKAFRCSNCGYTWTVLIQDTHKKEKETSFMPSFVPKEVGDFFKKVSKLETKKIKKQENLEEPSKIEKKKSKKRFSFSRVKEPLKRVLRFCFVFGSFLFFMTYFYPDFERNVLRPITFPLEFKVKDISVRSEIKNGNTNLNITGILENKQNMSQKAPVLIFNVLDENKKIIQEYSLHLDVSYLEAKEKYPFQMTLFSISKEAVRVEVNVKKDAR
ncbi:MAG: hypothetical protein EOM53_03275 [Alphaproteobacteria bacterium]|nr:zinc-ribbon domain-containing protein [Alphaproteobacteria bacterium]NCB49684.1 hypothetical protein [Alphaproteobacteria bacterium]